MKPRWLRHRIATPSPSSMPRVGERVGQARSCARGPRSKVSVPELVDDRRRVGVADRAERCSRRRASGPSARSVDASARQLVGRASARMHAGRRPASWRCRPVGERPRSRSQRESIAGSDASGQRQPGGTSPRRRSARGCRPPRRGLRKTWRWPTLGFSASSPASSSASPTALGQRAVVAGEAAREMAELGVVAAPLPHAVQALEDAPGDAARGVGVVVRAGDAGAPAPRARRARPPRAPRPSAGSAGRPPSRGDAPRRPRSGCAAPIGGRRSLGVGEQRGRERERPGRAGGRRARPAPRRRARRARRRSPAPAARSARCAGRARRPSQRAGARRRLDERADERRGEQPGALGRPRRGRRAARRRPGATATQAAVRRRAIATDDRVVVARAPSAASSVGAAAELGVRAARAAGRQAGARRRTSGRREPAWRRAVVQVPSGPARTVRPGSHGSRHPSPPPPRSASLGDRLLVDGLVVDDECAVRLAASAEAGEDPVALVADAIEIGARVLDREQAGAHADFVKAEFEQAARELETRVRRAGARGRRAARREASTRSSGPRTAR